jgi:hypothetical protein
MQNPFSKPHTPEQWLLGSVCWVVLSVGSWVLLVWLLSQSALAAELAVSASIPAFWISYAVTLWRSVVGARDFIHSPKAHMSLLGILGICWIILLSVYQVLGFAFGLVISVFAMYAFL